MQMFSGTTLSYVYITNLKLLIGTTYYYLLALLYIFIYWHYNMDLGK